MDSRTSVLIYKKRRSKIDKILMLSSAVIVHGGSISLFLTIMWYTWVFFMFVLGISAIRDGYWEGIIILTLLIYIFVPRFIRNQQIFKMMEKANKVLPTDYFMYLIKTEDFEHEMDHILIDLGKTTMEKRIIQELKDKIFDPHKGTKRLSDYEGFDFITIDEETFKKIEGYT